MGYKLLYDKQILFDVYTGDYVTDAQLSMSVNAASYFDFTISLTHSLYNIIAEHAGIVELYFDDAKLFSGEITKISVDLNGNKDITCTGALDYLSYTLVRPYSTIDGEADLLAPSSVDGYFNWLIEQHNKHCLDSRKHFSVGVNQGNLLDNNNYIYRASSELPTTASEIEDKILNSVGGYLYVRYKDDVNILDLYADTHEVNTQIIDFGVNITDFVKTTSTDEQYTAVIATGYTPDPPEDDPQKQMNPINLEGCVDGGTPYSPTIVKMGDVVYDVNAVARYGYKEYHVSNDDITTYDGLLQYACKILNKLLSPSLSVSVKAVDLSLYMKDKYEHMQIGQAVRVRSKLHNIDEYLVVNSITLDMNNPENTEYELGETYDTLTGQQSSYLRALNSSIVSNLDSVAKLDSETKKNAKDIAETKTVASDAVNKANKASEDATNAVSKSSEAIENANQAKTDAANASSKADAADNKAQDAKNTADKNKSEIISMGEQLVINGNGLMGDNTNFSSLIFDASKSNGSAGSFTRTGSVNSSEFSDNFFPISPTLRYSFELDAISSKAKASMYSYLDFYDVDKKRITADNHMYVENTLTTLAKDLKNGDTVVYLTNMTNWLTSGGNDIFTRGFIFWNYKNSFGYTYPENTYSRYTWFDLYMDSGINTTAKTITLKNPWTNGAFPAGTKVSQSNNGETFKYQAMGNSIPPTEWRHYSGYYDGTDYSGKNVTSKFPPGAAYAKVGFLWNYNKSDDQVWVTNISVKTDYKHAIDEVATRVTSAETSIKKNSDAIELRATKTEVTEVKNTADAAKSTADDVKTDLETNYSTTTQMNSAINVKADSIMSTVSETYQAKGDYAIKSEVNQTIEGVETKITTAQSTANEAKDTAESAKSSTNILETLIRQSGDGVEVAKKVNGEYTSSKTLMAPDGFYIKDSADVPLTQVKNDSIVIGKETKSHIHINPDDVTILDGNEKELARFYGNGLSLNSDALDIFSGRLDVPSGETIPITYMNAVGGFSFYSMLNDSIQTILPKNSNNKCMIAAVNDVHSNPAGYTVASSAINIKVIANAEGKTTNADSTASISIDSHSTLLNSSSNVSTGSTIVFKASDINLQAQRDLIIKGYALKDFVKGFGTSTTTDGQLSSRTWKWRWIKTYSGKCFAWGECGFNIGCTTAWGSGYYDHVCPVYPFKLSEWNVQASVSFVGGGIGHTGIYDDAATQCPIYVWSAVYQNTGQMFVKVFVEGVLA